MGNSYRGNLVAAGIGVAAVGAVAAVVLATGGFAQAAGKPGLAAPQAAAPTVTTTAVPPPADGYQFVQLGYRKDRHNNQLYAINNHGRIAGATGTGNKGNPNKGYTITPPYGQAGVKPENFPGSAQTSVYGLNDFNVQVGSFSTQNKAVIEADNSFGWYYNGKFHKVVFPAKDNTNPIQDALYGVNNRDIAVGTYRSRSGRYRSFTYNLKTGKFALVTKPGAPTGGNAPSLEAFAINTQGDIVGDYNTSGGRIKGFIKLAGGAFATIYVSGSVETAALGVNDSDTVVGAYIEDSGGMESIHGFIWHIGGHFILNVDDPHSTAFTYIDGINNEGDIAGSYLTSTGYAGYIAYPAF